MTKERILREIQRTASENGGVPLGMQRFAKATGIGQHVWKGKFWRAWSDALAESGFAPNAKAVAIPQDDLVVLLLRLTRKLGRVPSDVDLQMERKNDPSFPSTSPFWRLGGQLVRVDLMRVYATAHEGWEDLLALLPPPAAPVADTAVADAPGLVNGHVYLVVSHLKSGKHYKIGHTESVPRRHRQIALELPEKPELVHVIDTDDPAGIEAYWHNRFAAKRTNGEWFALTADDVRVFKRRKFM